MLSEHRTEIPLSMQVDLTKVCRVELLIRLLNALDPPLQFLFAEKLFRPVPKILDPGPDRGHFQLLTFLRDPSPVFVQGPRMVELRVPGGLEVRLEVLAFKEPPSVHRVHNEVHNQLAQSIFNANLSIHQAGILQFFELFELLRRRLKDVLVQVLDYLLHSLWDTRNCRHLVFTDTEL